LLVEELQENPVPDGYLPYLRLKNCANLFGIGIRAHLVVFNTPPNGPHQKLAPLLHGLA
jgi:hypothetical protein